MSTTSWCLCFAATCIFEISVIIPVFVSYVDRSFAWVVEKPMRELTRKKSSSCVSPFLQSFSSVLISPWRNNCLTLLPLCWNLTKVWILWRVLEHVVSLNFQSFTGTYSVNFPIWFNTLGGTTTPVSDLTWRVMIALSNSCVCSINSIQALLFFLTV
jgi:hypothetical protein